MMDSKAETHFLYLNRGNRWPSFQWQRLELLEDGSLQLFSVPRLEGKMPEDVRKLPTPAAPAGSAIAPDGAVYFTDPLRHRVMKIDPCGEQVAPVLCLGGLGNQPTQFNHPRGILYHHDRKVLIVADSGNHRLQLFHPETLQLLDIWGGAGSNPGHFHDPWGLAEDSSSSVYVVDSGNHRIQQFDPSGAVNPAFWHAVKDHIAQPAEIAIAKNEHNEEEIFILDVQQKNILVFDPDGHYVRSILSEHEHTDASGTEPILQAPMGLAVDTKAVYVGDNVRKRVLKFTRTGEYIGEAKEYAGPVAALTVDGHTTLWVHPGETRPLRLRLHGAHVTGGFLWSHAIGRQEHNVLWHRLQALADGLDESAHLQIFIYRTEDPTTEPPITRNPRSLQPFDPGVWQAFPLNNTDVLILGEPASFLRIGVHFTGEGRASARLQQLRLQYNHPSYSEHLPAIYRAEAKHRETLARVLGLFQSFFEDLEREIRQLPRLFDSETAPEPWLGWLARWLGLRLDETLPLAKKREAVARAYGMYAQRGTPSGLKQTIQLMAGVDVHIQEPVLHSAWWILPETALSGCEACQSSSSLLDFNTMLAVAEPQGAVVGTTAVLDRSHLIHQEEFGTPLFEDVAHQFTVMVYQGQAGHPKKLAQIRSLIEQEKPAHTTYHLCIIIPRMRVGFQARLGIDAIVAGPPQPSSLPAAPEQAEWVLAGKPAGQMGQARVGIHTRMSDFPETPHSNNLKGEQECM